MMKNVVPLALVFGLLSACAADTTVPLEVGETQAPTSWRAVATPEDRARLRDWRTAFVEGLSEARAAGHGAAIAQAGAVLQPDAARTGATPPVGSYRCRTIKLGRKDGSGLPFISYPWFRCEIGSAAGLLSFAKVSGSQRPVGSLFEDSSRRMVFLGTLMLGDEPLALQYGRDTERNLIGALERIGERRWRLLLPRPHFESDLDVIELVPEGTAG